MKRSSAPAAAASRPSASIVPQQVRHVRAHRALGMAARGACPRPSPRAGPGPRPVGARARSRRRSRESARRRCWRLTRASATCSADQPCRHARQDHAHRGDRRRAASKCARSSCTPGRSSTSTSSIRSKIVPGCASRERRRATPSITSRSQPRSAARACSSAWSACRQVLARSAGARSTVTPPRAEQAADEQQDDQRRRRRR